MEVKDVQPNQGNIDLVLTVDHKGDMRSFEKFGKKGKVCNAKVSDETGEIKMTLWNDDCDQVNEGDRIHLQNGWCSEYQGEKQLSTGKFGKIEVLEKAPEKSAELPEEKKEQEPQPEEDSEMVIEEETI